MLSKKQYEYFKAQVFKYESNLIQAQPEVISIGIQTDETPEYTLIESLNDMKDQYLELEKNNEAEVNLAVGKAYYLVSKMFEAKRTKQFIKQFCEDQLDDNDWEERRIN